MSVEQHDRFQEDIGAYLLGALEPAEQASFEGHLATCPECRAEVEECYGAERSGELGCVNPEFHELPVGSPTFKVIAQLAD